MDITLRIPLFYLMDMLFNCVTLHPQMIINEESFISNHNNGSSNVSTGLQNETCSITETFTEISKMEQPIFNFGQASLLHYCQFSIMLSCLSFMVIFLTPAERMIRVCGVTFIPIIVSSLVAFIPQVFEFSTILENYWIFIIRLLFFLIISCYMYFQCGRQSPCTTSTLGLIFAYFIVSILNVESVEFHFAKYVLSFVLIYRSALQKRSIFDFFAHKNSKISFVIIYIAYYSIYSLPLIFSPKKYLDITTEIEYRTMVKLILNTEGIRIVKNYVIICIILGVNQVICSCFDILLSVRRNKTSIAHCIMKQLIASPVIFYTFYIDRGLSALHIENIWPFLQPFLIIHSLSLLTKFSDTVKRSVRSKMTNTVDSDLIKIRHYVLTALICITSCILLGFCTKPLTRDFYWLMGTIIICYNIVVTLFLTILFVKSSIRSRDEKKGCKNVAWSFHLNTFHLLLRCGLYISIGSLLMSQFINSFILCRRLELLLLIGWLFYGCKALEVFRKNWFPSFNVFLVEHFLVEANEEKMKMLNAKCFVCDEEMSCDCYETACKHLFHKHCIAKDFFTVVNCPQCKTNLYFTIEMFKRLLVKTGTVQNDYSYVV